MFLHMLCWILETGPTKCFRHCSQGLLLQVPRVVYWFKFWSRILIRSLLRGASKSLTEPSVILSSLMDCHVACYHLFIFELLSMYCMLQKCCCVRCIGVQVYLIISVNSVQSPSVVERQDCSRHFSQHFCNNPSSINTPCCDVWVKK